MGVNYNPKIVTDGLVLHLDAANPKSYPGSGTTWFDLSKNGNDGTLVNGVGYDNNNFGSLSFDGSNDYINIGTITNNLSLGISMEIVFKSNDLDSRMQGIMRYNAHPYYINFWCPGDGRFRWETWAPSPSGGGARFTSKIMLPNTWYHAVGTFFNNNSSLYLNGINLINALYNPGDYGSSYSASFRVGEYAGYISGNIALAKMYNRALTPQEAKQNFNAIRSRYGI